MRRWWAAHPNYKRQYRAANRDRLNAQDKARRDRMDPEKKSTQKRKWRQSDRARNYDKTRAREAAYQAAHPGVMTDIKRRYKARKRGATSHHTVAEWRELVGLHCGLCFYCGLPKKLERDHRVPLSRGGNDNIENIMPSCRMCNLRKSARTTREYLALLAAERAA